MADTRKLPCPACDGSGVEVFGVTIYEPGCGFSHPSTDERSCEACGGSGDAPLCPRCGVISLGPRPIFLGTRQEGHICDACWQQDRAEVEEDAIIF